jgi:hypothetical protein
MRNITIAAISFLVTFAIGMTAARAQSTSSMTLALTQKSFEVSTADDMAKINLIKEIQKINPAAVSSGQLEIQMLRVTAKTGVGGAQFFLHINGDYVDSQSLETDPDQLASADLSSAGRVELKNIERDQIKEASLVIQGYSNARIFSVQVILGPVTEVAILGHYADEQVQEIGGASATDDTQDVILKPSAETLNDIQDRYYAAGSQQQNTGATTNVASQMAQTLQNVAAAVRNGGAGTSSTTPAQPATPPAVVSSSPSTRNIETRTSTAASSATPAEKPRSCVVNQRGNQICVGDKVRNRWGFSGTVEAIGHQNGQSVVLVKFGFGDSKWRDANSVSN